MGHPSYFQRLPRLGSVTARQSTSERQPNIAALNRGRHLCSAGRPSRWALAHISSLLLFSPHLPLHGRWEAESTKAVQYGHASRFGGGGTRPSLPLLGFTPIGLQLGAVISRSDRIAFSKWRDVVPRTRKLVLRPSHCPVVLRDHHAIVRRIVPSTRLDDCRCRESG